MKRSAMIMNPRVLLLFFFVFFAVSGIFWFFHATSKSPTYAGTIERRDYEHIVIPLEGTSLDARVHRIKHRLAKPGQAKLIKRFTSSTTPKDLQSALEEFGYKFPAGTKVVSVNSTVPVFYIQHYPDVLDSFESEFQLERR
jgi:hypothetical protein